jgi:hypothetical protein
MNTVFDEPSAHNVSHMEAKLHVGDETYCALRLRLTGESRFTGPCGGDFVIFGLSEMREKFRTVADAINGVFGVKTDENGEIIEEKVA